MGVLLALLVGVVGFFAVPASPALADEHPQLEVRINAVSPALIDPTDEGQLVTITGTVTNTSARDMRYVNVHFWRSRQPLTGLDEINDAVSAPLSSPLGSRLDSLESGNLDLLAAEDPFPPGETANFTVQATVAQLELPTVSDAVYRLGVHVRAIPNGDSNTTVGRARVLVPASPLDLPVSATVLLSSRPVAHADGDPINQQESARLLSAAPAGWRRCSRRRSGPTSSASSIPSSTAPSESWQRATTRPHRTRPPSVGCSASIAWPPRTGSGGSRRAILIWHAPMPSAYWIRFSPIPTAGL